MMAAFFIKRLEAIPAFFSHVELRCSVSINFTESFLILGVAMLKTGKK